MRLSVKASSSAGAQPPVQPQTAGSPSSESSAHPPPGSGHTAPAPGPSWARAGGSAASSGDARYHRTWGSPAGSFPGSPVLLSPERPAPRGTSGSPGAEALRAGSSRGWQNQDWLPESGSSVPALIHPAHQPGAFGRRLGWLTGTASASAPALAFWPPPALPMSSPSGARAWCRLSSGQGRGPA